MEIEFRCRWYQRPFHEYLTGGGKRAIEIAHRRWGKDEVTLAVTREMAFKRPASYWHCLPEYEQARKALWTAVDPHTGKRRIDIAFPRELRANTNEQEMFIRFVNGSTWQLQGSDRFNAQVGAGVAGIVYSEWALANPSAWGYHRPMLEENDGWAAFITTSRGKNHAFRMLEHAKGSPKWFAEVSTIADTNALSKEQLDEALAEYISLYGEDEGAAHFEQEYFCSFNAAIIGSYYSKQMRKVTAEGRIRPVPYDPEFPVHTAWDIGRSDDTVIWFYQVIAGEIRIISYWAAAGSDVDYVMKVMAFQSWVGLGAATIEEIDVAWLKANPSWRKRYGRHHLPHDAKAKTFASSRSVIEQMADFLEWGSLVIVPDIGVQDGIQAVRRMLPRCYFDVGVEDGIEALRQYQREWDDVRKVFRLSPLHNWASHPADAFRMLAVAWREEPTASVPEKPRLLMVGPDNQVTLEDMWAAHEQRKTGRI